MVCDLHPLISRSASEIDGLFPVLDSLRGVCGQLRAVVRMTLLIDHNPREVPRQREPRCYIEKL